MLLYGQESVSDRIEELENGRDAEGILKKMEKGSRFQEGWRLGSRCNTIVKFGKSFDKSDRVQETRTRGLDGCVLADAKSRRKK